MMATNKIYYRMFGYVFTLVMHTVNIIVILCSFNEELMKDPVIRHFKQMEFFLVTSWNLVFQLFFAAFSLYCDIRILRNTNNDYKLSKFCENVRREFFSIILWPTTCLVFIVFWAFLFYDRELLYPTKLDMVITTLSNQILHGYILPVLLWEMVFNYRPKPKTHTLRIISKLLIAVVYIIVVFSVKKYYGIWIYPILAKMKSTILISVFFIVTMLILVGLYHLQWLIYAALWGQRQKTSTKRP